MIHLELTDREAKDLKTALSIRHVGMLEELAHTDDRSYRADLKATTERLEVVIRRLDQLVAGMAP